MVTAVIIVLGFLTACKKTDEKTTEKIDNWITVEEFKINLPAEYKTFINHGDDKDIYAAFKSDNTILFVSKEDYESLKDKGYDPVNMTLTEYIERWKLTLDNCVMSPEETFESDGLTYIGYYKIREDSSTSYVSFFYDANDAFWAFAFTCPRYADEDFVYEELYYGYLEIAKSVTFKLE